MSVTGLSLGAPPLTEDPVAILRRDTGAGVLDSHFDGCTAVANRQPNLAARGFRHLTDGVDGIVDEVSDHRREISSEPAVHRLQMCVLGEFDRDQSLCSGTDLGDHECSGTDVGDLVGDGCTDLRAPHGQALDVADYLVVFAELDEAGDGVQLIVELVDVCA